MAQALDDLAAARVSVWLDDLSRPRILTGSLARMVDGGEIVGITTNPTIFAKAIGAGSGYEEQLRDLALRGTAIGETLRLLTAWDVRAACDILRPVYDRTAARDGRVSIEVDPRISGDADRTAAEARGLWWLVDRPNLFIKIPATLAGLPAITASLADGISVNVTLIFSLDRYRAVLDAFLTGLEQRKAAGGSLVGIESVASFFISRVDTEVDRQLAQIDGAGRRQGFWQRSLIDFEARRLSPMHAWLMRYTSRCWYLTAGRRWRQRGPVRSACSGRRLASRIRRSAIRAMSPIWWRPTRSTPCQKQRCSPSPTTAKSVVMPFVEATLQHTPRSRP